MTGATLGPYRLDAELGAGGMGKVWRATGPDGVVALKVIHRHLVADADAMARFRREAAVGIAVRHPNVVATLRAGDGEGRHWLALEYVEGQTLHALRQELGTVPEELCRHVAHEVAAGLAAIHAAGIVHRDLKPENVIITKAHVVKVMDLGVARGGDDDARVTKTGAFVGSLQYAAPEQFEGGGKGLDGRVDLHALGVVLYELATGSNPYEDADWRVVFRRVLKETPRRLGAVNPQVSPFFEEVVHTLLAKDREARFASAAELVRVLDEGERSSWWKGRAAALRAETKRPLRRIRIPRETALYGREAELTVLRSLYERASEGDGRAAVVEGEAGIGKSRLVDEFVGLLQQGGEDVNFLYGSYPPGGAATASGAFSTAYLQQFGDDGCAAWLRDSPALVPAFDALLRGETTPPSCAALTKESIHTCFVRATHALAEERTTIVLVDDLHFAPDDGRGLFAALALAVPGRRILLVGTTRPGLDEDWLAGIVRIGARRLPLARLGAKDLVALLADTLRSEDLAEELAGRIAVKSDGNPFFVFEILRALREGQRLARRADGTWATTRALHEIEIPSSVLDLVGARVAGLDREERDLLDLAACRGFEFDPTLVAAAAGVPVVPALKRFAQIERGRRLVRAAGPSYVFDHHQVQEALYRGLHEQLRRHYHEALGHALEARLPPSPPATAAADGAACVDVAEQFLRAGRGDRAARWFEPAFAHLEERQLNDAAVGLGRLGLAMPGMLAGSARIDVLLRLVRRYDILGRRDDVRTALDEASALAAAEGDLALRALTGVSRTVHLRQTGRLDEAHTAASAALELARASGDLVAEVRATSELVDIAELKGRTEEALELQDREVELARRTGDPRREASAIQHLAILHVQLGRMEDAQRGFERCIEIARATGDRVREVGSYVNVGFVLCARGRFGDAQQWLDRGLAGAREIGHRLYEANACGNLGSVFLALGETARALERYERQLVLAREIQDVHGEISAMANLGSVSRIVGRADEAREWTSRSAALARASGDRNGEIFALAALAGLDDESGATGAAAAGHDSCAAAAEGSSDHEVIALVFAGRGAFLARQGRPDAARADLERALATARASSMPGAALRAAAWLANLPGGDPAPAAAALAEDEASLDVENAMEASFLLWRAAGDRAHLAGARRRLDHLVAHAPPECREAMLANVRLHREIVAASASASSVPRT